MFVDSILDGGLGYLGSEEDPSVTVWGIWQGYTGGDPTNGILGLIEKVVARNQNSGKKVIFFEFGSHSGWLSISLALRAVPTLSLSQNDEDASKLRFAAHMSDLQQNLTVSTLEELSGPEILLDFAANVDADAGFAIHSNAHAGIEALEWCVKFSDECLKKLEIATLFAPATKVSSTSLAGVLRAYLRSSEGFAIYFSGSICEYMVSNSRDSGINYPSVLIRKISKLITWEYDSKSKYYSWWNSEMYYSKSRDQHQS